MHRLPGRRAHEREVETAHIRMCAGQTVEHAIEGLDLGVVADYNRLRLVSDRIELLGKQAHNLGIVACRRDALGCVRAEFGAHRGEH